MSHGRSALRRTTLAAFGFVVAAHLLSFPAAAAPDRPSRRTKPKQSRPRPEAPRPSPAEPVAAGSPDLPLPALIEPSQTHAPGVYRARREALMREMGGEGVAVVFARGEEDGDGYRQSPDFLYLTGVLEQGAVLVLAPGERTHREFLLLPSRDPEAERWTGERDPIGMALRRRYGFEKVFRTGRLDGLMLDLAGRSPVLWQASRPDPGGDGKPPDLDLYGRVSSRIPGVSIKTLGWTLARMRSRHSPGEIALMQRAVRITEEGFRSAAAALRAGATEGLLEAEAERTFKAAGARRPAFSSIVGSGRNSTILHYPRSERALEDGDLVVMDMGAEFAHYAADVTRTLPVSGRFTPEQRKIYDLVLNAQKTALSLVRPGAYYEDIEAAARKIIEDGGYGDAFIHGLGHFVGLDVHDAGDYHQPLAAGMVITLEPGIYIPDRGIGVRIEDDVLVTETGARILSDGLPREADAIERWLASLRAAGSN